MLRGGSAAVADDYAAFDVDDDDDGEDHRATAADATQVKKTDVTAAANQRIPMIHSPTPSLEFGGELADVAIELQERDDDLDDVSDELLGDDDEDFF